MSVAEQLFHQYFQAAEEEEECEQLQRDSKMRVSICSIIAFGRILQKNKVPSVHGKRGNFYKVVRIKPGKQ